jgi:hypothetical protein
MQFSGVDQEFEGLGAVSGCLRIPPGFAFRDICHVSQLVVYQIITPVHRITRQLLQQRISSLYFRFGGS